jgi:signal transduction histidine kinase
MNFFKLLSVMFFFTIFLYAANEPSTINKLNEKNTPFLYLTDQEKRFLQEKKELKMCVNPHWMPYEKIESGKYTGISSDYIQHISKLIKIPVHLVATKTWSESLALFKDHQCDILPLVTASPSHAAFMNFTKSYFTSPLVVATLNDKSFVSDLSKLKEQKIGILRNCGSSEILQHKYLNVNFVQIDTLVEGLTKVANGELYGFIDSLTTIAYQIQKRFPTQLKIAAQLHEEIAMSIGLHKDDPLLLEILNKSVNLVKDDTKKDIVNDWISVKFDRPDLQSSIQAFWKIISPILLLGILLIISHYVLRQYNKKLKKQVHLNIEALREKDEMLLQKQRMAAMGEMLSLIAHQWRQPLGAINSAIMGINIKIESGRFDLNDPIEQQKFLEYLKRKHDNIIDSVQYLSTTTDDFRNFFNPNKSKEPTPLIAPIENALKVIEHSLRKNGIEIIKELQINPEVTMYSNEIMQVLLNLLKNSEYNFLDKKIQDPIISIETFYQKHNSIIRICDNGSGIPKEIAKKIFEPYFSTKEEKHGAGLGLYMSKVMIEEHHDALLHMINQDRGVCFEIIFKNTDQH